MSNKKPMSWGWIIFWFILFWPVGAFFLFRRLTGDKTAMLENSKTMFSISYFLMAIGIFCLIITLTDNSKMFSAVLVFGGAGIVFNYLAERMKKIGQKYKKYTALVLNQAYTQIDDIASEVGVSYDDAKLDLQKMIDAGYFIGAYINDGSRKIVLARCAETPAFQPSPISIPTHPQVVSCKSCGANNTLTPGQRNECEYCGSPLA